MELKRMSSSSIAISIVPSPEHNLQSHPENVSRFQYFDQLINMPQGFEVLSVEPVRPTDEILESVHPREYIQTLAQAVKKGPGFIDHGDTYITQESLSAARKAVGGMLGVLNSIAAGNTDVGFALIRPPGHHATATQPMGFCLLNNVAIAARYAQGLRYKKVLIVDFDVHHGNGTQAIFDDDPDVLYFSTHQVGIFPGSGHIHEIGRGDGVGTSINVPLPAMAGDEAISTICNEILCPRATIFEPDILLVSAGFDAHWDDPLANLQFTIAGYHRISTVLKSIANDHCDGKILFVLEGGYNPKTLLDAIKSVLSALSGRPAPEIPGDVAPYTEPSIFSLVDQVRQIHNL